MITLRALTPGMKTALIVLCLLIIIVGSHIDGWYTRRRLQETVFTNALLTTLLQTQQDTIPAQQARTLSVDLAALQQRVTDNHFIYHRDRDIHTLQIAQPISFDILIASLAPLVDTQHCLTIASAQLDRKAENTITGNLQLKEKKACHA